VGSIGGGTATMRVLVTVPAIALNIVTFPVQVVVFLYMAKTHQIG